MLRAIASAPRVVVCQRSISAGRGIRAPAAMVSPARSIASIAKPSFHNTIAMIGASQAAAGRSRGFRGAAVIRANIPESSCAECAEMHGTGAYVYLDVRTVEEFSAGHAPGAINVPVIFMSGGGREPNPDFAALVEAAIPDKDSEVLVGCKSGMRSQMAGGIMKQLGYSALTNVGGGYDAWAAGGHPSE